MTEPDAPDTAEAADGLDAPEVPEAPDGVRQATPAEVSAITGFFERIEEGLSQHALGNRDLFLVDREGDVAVTMASPDLIGLPPEVLEATEHIGLRIGGWTDDGIALDLQGAALIARHSRKQAIRVTEKAARLFLYGRDIFGSSVRSFDPRLNAGDFCIVCNVRWESLGIGEVMGRFKGDVAVVQPIHDLGEYLRDQGSTRRRDVEA